MFSLRTHPEATAEIDEQLAYLKTKELPWSATKFADAYDAALTELKRRIKEVDSGKAKLIPGEVVMAKLKAMQAKSHAKAEAKVTASRIDWSKKPRLGLVPAEDVLANVRLAFSRRSKSRPPRK